MREYLRRENESLLGYYKRITENRKELDIDYSEWAKLISGKDYSSENGRKMYYCVKPMLDTLEEEYLQQIPKNKMEEIKEELGELFVVKQEVKNKTNRLNKIKRDFVKSIEISNDIKEYIKEDIENIELFNLERIHNESENKLIVHCGDWHIGYVINGYKGNHYNYEIAKARLQKLLYEIEKTCKIYNITDVIVINCGDITEGIGMRQNQSYECEFNMNEQISKSIKLLYEFITSISKMNYNVDLITVGGNHQRGQGSKDANIEGDNNNIVIKEQIETLIEVSGNNRIRVLDVDYKDDSCYFDVFNTRILAIHGDNRVADAKKLFDSENVDLILRGHWHNYNVSSQNNNGKVITCGCLFGYNPYSVKKMACTTGASQNLIVISKDGIESIKDVDLQIV